MLRHLYSILQIPNVYGQATVTALGIGRALMQVCIVFIHVLGLITEQYLTLSKLIV